MTKTSTGIWTCASVDRATPAAAMLSLYQVPWGLATAGRSAGSCSPMGWKTRPPLADSTCSEAKCLKYVPKAWLAVAIKVSASRSARLSWSARCSAEKERKSALMPVSRMLNWSRLVSRCGHGRVLLGGG